MDASWACEVTEILTQRSIEEASFVGGLVTSQAQLATKYKHSCFCCKKTLFKNSFLSMRVHIV